MRVFRPHFSTGLFLAISLLTAATAVAQETSWPGVWQKVDFQAQLLVCKQTWKCVNPRQTSASDAKGQRLTFDPEMATTEGVCLGSGPGCKECGAEQPPNVCTVALSPK